MSWTPGVFEIRELVPEKDVFVLHPWFDMAYAQYWNMRDMTADAVLAFYKAMQSSSHEWAWVGVKDGKICFLAECYIPNHHEIAEHYKVEQGDIGMHICVAPATTHQPGYTLEAIRHVLYHLFSNVGARRVIVEPDIRNEKVRALNRRAGFVELRPITLTTKQAMLSILTQASFIATLS